MPAIRVHEAALCCDTGVCGPDLDLALLPEEPVGEEKLSALTALSPQPA